MIVVPSPKKYTILKPIKCKKGYIFRINKNIQNSIKLNFDQINGKILIEVENDTKAQIYAELKEISLLNVDIKLEDNSELEFKFIVNPLSNTKINQKCLIKRNAMFNCRIITRGSVDHRLVSEVIGKNSTSNIKWVFHAIDSQRQMVSVKNLFNAKEGNGNVVIKGVAENNAHIVCKGMVAVGNTSHSSLVTLKEDVLVLDNEVALEMVPAMEIKNDDVKASHSASVRMINLEDLFYFSSRGVSEADARHMIVEGFLE